MEDNLFKLLMLTLASTNFKSKFVLATILGVQHRGLKIPTDHALHENI